MTTGIWPRELLISRIEILHIWIWCTNLMFMMKNKKLSFQNLQVASDVMNLKIISVKMSIWIPKMPKSLMRSLCAWLMRDNFNTGDNRWAQLSVAPTFKMVSIRVRCIRGPVQRVPGNVATRINVRCIGMYNRHLDILLTGENAYSMRRKRPN